MAKTSDDILAKYGVNRSGEVSGADAILKKYGTKRSDVKTSLQTVSDLQSDEKPKSVVAGILSGAAKSTAAGYTNAAGTLMDMARAADMRASSENQRALQEEKAAVHYREMAARGTMDDGTVLDEEGKQRLLKLADHAERVAQVYRDSNEKLHQPLAEVTQKTYQMADRLSAESSQEIEAAKEGKGAAGSFLVDAGVAGTQLVGDMAANLLLPGAGMAGMAVRGFGSSAQKARQSGATLGQQAAYGAGSAALSVATEKIANVAAPFTKTFGKGVLDEAIRKMTGKLGQTAAGRIALSALSEGAEEFVEDIFQPVLQKATYNKDAKFDWGEALYDAAVGGLLGGLGGAAENVGRSRMDIRPKLDADGSLAWQTELEKVPEGNREQFQQAKRIAGRFGANLTIGEMENGASGQYQNGNITISPKASNPVRQVLIHELTHHMETSGMYDEFSGRVLGYVAQDMGVDVEAMKQSIIEEYSQFGEILDEEGASRELVAKFAEEKLFRDEASIRRLAQTDRNLFQKVYDWIRDNLKKFRGTSEEKFLQDAQKLYEKALEGVGMQKSMGEAQNTFAGQNARTADLNALKTAADLEAQGIDANAIRQQTGWFRGMDGKWRFEIDDSGMEYQRNGFTQNPDMVRRRELENKLLYGDVTQEEFDELQGLTEATRGVPKPSTLGEYIRHNALFAAYPELADVKVRFEELGNGERGSYSKEKNTITLDAALRNAPEDTIIHEVQHAIQNVEGFTGGASPEYWAANRPEGSFRRAEELYRNTAGEIEARDAAERWKLTPDQRELKMPQLGGENTVFADQAGKARDYIPGVIGEDVVLQGIREVAGMEPVSNVQGTEFAKGEVDLVTQVTNYFDSLGNMVFNQQLGDVKLSRNGAKSDIAHGIGRKKAAAFAAVPSILENGRVIDYQTNWKGRGYDTAVVAAPITIQGENYLAGVVLTRSQKENSFYLHEVLLTEKGTAPFKTGGRVSGNPGGDVPSVISLLRQVQEVKENRSTEDITPKLDVTMESNSVGQNSIGRSFSELVQDIAPKLVDEHGMTAEERAERQKAQQAAEPTPVERLGGQRVVGDQGNYTNTAFIRGADQSKKDTTRSRRQAEARLQPTRGEKLFAKGIANGDYSVDDIPVSMSRSTVTELADYYTVENSYKATDGVRERGRQIRAENEQMAAELFKDEESFKPISMLRMNERTPERVMRNIFGDKQGEIINEKYIYPVQQNEAGKMRFIQNQLDQVRTFEDSTGQRSELNKEERAIVQQIMEDRFVEETVASMEVAQGIRNAAENIMRGKDPIDAGKEFSLNAEERALAQQLARWMQNQEQLESGNLDSVKINNAVQKYAQQYDMFYDAVNDFLTAHGYGTIGFIKGYAPHMQGVDTQNKLLSALRSLGVNTDVSSLPTSISGLTADYKPGKRWNPFFQQRLGSKTDYDVAKGYESYVSYLGDIFYHTDDIARLRGVSRYLRKTYGPEEINNAIDHAESLRYADLQTQTEVLKDAGKISEGTKLTYEDAKAMMDEYIDELYDNVTKVTKYGEFVKFIDNYANLLAGKQSMADRGMEYMAGRTSLNAGNKLVAAFGRAQVAGNVSSVLNQSSQLAQIAAEVDGKYIAQAVLDLGKSTKGRIWNIKKTELFDQSDLLTGKKGIEYLTADDSKFERMVSAMFKPADIMDSMVSALAVQSKYNQLVAEGKPAEAAMLEADRWATQIMASRMKGSRPMAFESKSVVNQMLHMFQVEAMNSWEHLSQDLPYKYRNLEKAHGKKAATRAVATVLSRGLISAFLLNRAAEAVYGGTPAPFDVLGYIANFVSSGFGMATNETLKKLINAGWKDMFGESLLDDDDDDKELRPFNWGAAASDAVYNISNDIPFVRNAAGLLGLGDQTMPFTNMAEAVRGVGKALTAEEKSAGEIGGSLLELGSTVMPGGRQIQKTTQGINTMVQGGRTYGYGDKKRMQYTVENTPENWAKAVLFGNSGLSETRDFYASDESGLSAKHTRLVEEMTEEGADRETVFKAAKDIRSAEKTAGKMEALDEQELTDLQKWKLYSEMIASSESKRPEAFKKMLIGGMTWNQVSDVYLEYLYLDEQKNISATEKATLFAAYLNGENLSDKQKSEIKDVLKFFSQIPAEAKKYEEMTNAGLSSSAAMGLTKAIENLTPEIGKDGVSDIQRYNAVVNYGLSKNDQIKALQTMMEENEFEKMMVACDSGLSPKQYVEFKSSTQNIESDRDGNGKTITNSKKKKIMEVIDEMQLTVDQKDALYYAAGYKKSTLYDDAPWYDIRPKLTSGGAAMTQTQKVLQQFAYKPKWKFGS